MEEGERKEEATIRSLKLVQFKLFLRRRRRKWRWRWRRQQLDFLKLSPNQIVLEEETTITWH